MIGRLWDQQRAILERQNVETARAISLAIDQEVEIGRSALKVASTLELIEGPDLGGLDRLARRLLPGAARLACAGAGRSAGRILFDSAGRGEAAAQLGDGEWIRSVVTTQRSAVSNLFRDPVASGHFFMISVPVTDYGVPKYVLAAQVRSSSLSDILRRQRAPPGGVVSLVDRGAAHHGALAQRARVRRHLAQRPIQGGRRSGCPKAASRAGCSKACAHIHP